jgi:serine phosphatase RsbU (regulator of sigma subunit)
VADRELTKLHITQSRLLPQAPPQLTGYKIAFRYRPFYFATGDYHDFFPRPDGSLAVFVGDSTGHGPSACMVMATMRALLYTHQEASRDPGIALSRLGQMLHPLIPSDLFMTAAYVELGRGGRVQWAAAGQHPPLRMSPTGEVAPTQSDAAGLPLGIEPQPSYRTFTWQLDISERLLVFTDGINEATNRDGRMFGVARLRTTLEELAKAHMDIDALVQTVVDRVKDYMEGSDFEDDFTVLAIERTEEK